MTFVLLHTGSVAPDTPFLLAWSFPPVLTLGLIVAGAAYAWGLDRTRTAPDVSWPTWYAAAFYAGLFAVAVALLGPLDTFNDELFSMHMIQHLVLMLVAAPLLLLGRPVQLALRALPPRKSRRFLQLTIRPRSVRGLLTFLTLPITVAVLYNGNMVLWHVPALYDASLASDAVHALMHAAFFATALIFWWPIIEPVPRHHRFSTTVMLVQLAIAMLVGKILGGLFTFASTTIYSSYDQAGQLWGLSPLQDQQLGGAFMLVGGLTVYASLFLIALARALIAADKRQTAKERRTRRSRQPSVDSHALGPQQVGDG